MCVRNRHAKTKRRNFCATTREYGRAGTVFLATSATNTDRSRSRRGWIGDGIEPRSNVLVRISVETVLDENSI